MIFDNIKELIKYREVLYALSLREIKSKYHQTFIGFFWAIIQPLSLMIILSIVFDKFFKIDSTNIPYPIFLYSTLVPWNFFARSITGATGILISNRLLVTKVYFPKEILPISLIISNIFDFLAAYLVLILMMIYYNMEISLNLFMLIPIFIIQLIFITAVTLFLSATNVYFRDIASAVPLLIQAWMYASPVIYSSQKIPEKYIDLYMLLNPMSPVIEAYRTIITDGSIFKLKFVFISFIISVIMCVVSYLFFKKTEKSFADIV